MSSVALSGLPAIVLQVGFVVVAALPVWFGAQVTGAAKPTLLRSALALIVGMVISVVGLMIGGLFGLLLMPVAFLLSFKFLLDMSFGGAFVLCIITVVGYVLMAKFIGGGVAFDKDKEEATALLQSGPVVEMRIFHLPA